MHTKITTWLLCLLFIACRQAPESTSIVAEPVKDTITLVSAVMSHDAQVKLTPAAALQDLLAGNKRFQAGKNTAWNYPAQVKQTTNSQFPKAVVLSCIDSRVPVEDIFNQGIGDIFVCRVAGNFVNTDLLGSLEFSCKVTGARLIIVLGHSNCGAIKGAIDNVQLGNITEMLTAIKPAIGMSRAFPGDHTSKNYAFVDDVAENNVRFAIQQIRAKSPILKEMEEKGEIKIVGAMYSLADGSVQLIP